MAGEVLDVLREWYAAQCNGDWEQEYGVTIGTLEDSGWQLRVDLVGTALAGVELQRDLTVRGDQDWLEVWSDGFTFNANGGVVNLRELLAAFAGFAERSGVPA
ncbi:MAG: Imm53 family immunity protein [Gaiellaceae bacterium]